MKDSTNLNLPMKTESSQKMLLPQKTNLVQKKYLSKKTQLSQKMFLSKKMLSPKLDVVFQAIFGAIGSEAITKKFIQSILKNPINQIKLNENQILQRQYESKKLGILDMIAKINGEENCNIEIQLVEQRSIIKRILYYWSRIYSRDLKRGEGYEKLNRTITILIADFELKELEDLEYHTKWKIIEEKHRKTILTEQLEIHIIELPKVAKSKEDKDELLDWLTFLENPNSERVKKKMEENEELKQAVEKLEQISEDETMQRLADLREKAIRDEISIRSTGLEEGIEQGLKEGMQKGIQKGEKQGKIDVAKKMLEKGIDMQTIIELTGLSKEEIENASK